MTPLAKVHFIICELSELSWPVLAAAGALTLALCFWGMLAVRGTTLRGPAGWSVLAVLLLAVTAALEAREGGLASQAAPLRYLAAIASLVPAMAVFGAKRPQDRAWFFIVLSLLIVLALPAAESWALRRGAPIELHGFRSVFILVLVFAGLGNYLPTRYALAVVVLAAGQWLLLDEFSAWRVLSLDDTVRRRLGTACILAAPWLALILNALARRSDDWQGSWRRFRDAYGVIWSVRVAERFNQAMRQRQTPIRLNWRGFADSSPAASTSALLADDLIDRTAARSLRALLMRFVSPDWLPKNESSAK